MSVLVRHDLSRKAGNEHECRRQHRRIRRPATGGEQNGAERAGEDQRRQVYPRVDAATEMAGRIREGRHPPEERKLSIVRVSDRAEVDPPAAVLEEEERHPSEQGERCAGDGRHSELRQPPPRQHEQDEGRAEQRESRVVDQCVQPGD
jgi:hypothetical protein